MGGWVLYAVLAVCLIMIYALTQCWLFRYFHYQTLKKQLLFAYSQQPNADIRQSLLYDLVVKLTQWHWLIKLLIVVCPLLGLLGTVSGMIQVFEGMALHGTGNPRLMAAGVSSATLPTMSGMAVAVLGLLFFNRIQHWSTVEQQKISLLS